MLKIEDLHVNVENKKILQGLDLEISPGEIHAIMGPNGSGKSTVLDALTFVLFGKPFRKINKPQVVNTINGSGRLTNISPTRCGRWNSEWTRCRLNGRNPAGGLTG